MRSMDPEMTIVGHDPEVETYRSYHHMEDRYVINVSSHEMVISVTLPWYGIPMQCNTRMMTYNRDWSFLTKTIKTMIS